MRWKDSGINYSSGTAKIVGIDPYICIYDNGTTICDKGHKISTIGRCRSQSLGKSNSTDDTFQPTYSICTVDYERLGSSKHINNVSNQVSGSHKVDKSTTASGIAFSILQSLSTDKSDSLYVKAISIDNYSYPFVIADYINDDGPISHNSGTVSMVQKILQRDSGWVSRTDASFSDLYDLDIFGFATVLHPYFYTLKKQTNTVINKAALNYGVGHTIASGTGTAEPGGTGENPTDICVGDQTAPTLENISPVRSSALATSSEQVSFDVVDAIGGVKLASLYITVSGSDTTQSGGYSIVEAGVVQTPDYAALTGTQTRYSFLYNPPVSWAQNEQVSITITGSDNKPLDEDEEEFVCSGSVNTFYDAWSYKVENIEDFTASITAIADDGAPYLDSISPMPYLGYTDDTSDISFYLKDDLSGVDINTVNIYINSVQVIQNGTPLVSAAAIAGAPDVYTFTYTNPSAFVYGSRVFVRVVADDLYATSPNSLDYTYYFDVVSDSTVSFDNFVPEVGITWNPELLNIGVDVTDSVYDIDVSGLYLSINGDVCSSTMTPLYGNRELTSTVSGVDYICGALLDNTIVTEATLAGVTLSGSDIHSGDISAGDLGVGWMSSFPSPFSSTSISSTISGTLYEGTLTSGTVTSVLVSGVNWDGAYVGSTLTGVDLTAVYATDVCTSGTVISGTIGQHLSYHPPNDFNYQGAINVLVHGTNLSVVSPVTRETIYQLLYGYNIKSFDRTFNRDSRVNVYVNAYNSEDFQNSLSYGFYFETLGRSSSDMTASITGIAPWEDLSATIVPQAPVHMYGKLMEVILYAEDYEGNALGPLTYYYTIESAPG